MYIRKKELGNNINFNNFIYLDLKGSNYRNDFDRTIRFFNEPCFLFFFREKFYTIKQESKLRSFSLADEKKEAINLDSGVDSFYQKFIGSRVHV